MATKSAVKVGALACQMSSYLRERSSVVLSCEASKNIADLFEVVLDDSVLFPEGGGQPHDLGVIGTAKVVNVQRRGDACVITTASALEVGGTYPVVVDWKRRLDHMQHHSAQHLVTAIVERELKLPTMSWALSHPTCSIQLPTAKIDEADVRKVEAICNDLIRQQTPVVRTMYDTKDDVPQARSRGIPSDVTGPIRIIDIAGCDTCTCCGTHVQNLSELQVVKLLHQEPKGNTLRLHFVTGERCIEQFSQLFELQRQLCKELGTSSDNLVASVQRRSGELTAANKRVKKLLAEFAPLAAGKAAEGAVSLLEGKQLFFQLYEEADIDFLTTVSAELTKKAPSVVVVLGCGGADDGQFVVSGPPDQVGIVAPRVVELLEGKGGMSKMGYRGKGNMKKWKSMQKNMMV